METVPKKLIYALFAIFCAGFNMILLPAWAQSSVLQSGTWYKMAMEKNGVYKIDRALFKKMGFDPASIDPRKIKIYSNEGGMLPQSNSAGRPTDLTELAIFVQGESDGIFNSGDYILFYAQGADRVFFNPAKEIFSYEKNLYADKNYCFITVANDAGKRVTTATSPGSGFPVINEFENFVHHELDQHSELNSGREWFGEKFGLTPELTLNLDLGHVIAGSTIKLVTDVMAKSFDETSFRVYLNGVQVIQQNLIPISTAEFGTKGRDKRDTVSFNANTVFAPDRSSQEIRYRYVYPSTGIHTGYLDFFLLQVTQQLALYGQQTLFRSLASLENPVSTFEIDQSTFQTIIWDVTDPYEPVVQPSSFNNEKTSFAAVTSVLKEFAAFTPNVPAPELVGAVNNQNIQGVASPNFLIVTHPDFKSEALRLAAHRNSLSGITVEVVTTEEVYNEFSSGRQDISAIRDFAKHLYNQSPGTLKALLLFGKGSYDYKKRVVDNINLVPIYESRNSLDPLLTYASDDYFSFLENHEGFWDEQPVVNHSMDISIGRLPVKNTTEAKNVVDKIIRYDTDKSLRGRWRKEIVFVADDGDANFHVQSTDDLSQFIDTQHPAFNTDRIFLDQYQQVSKPAGKVSPETRNLIEEAFYRGALVINYAGHGGERLWAQEKIFDDIMIEQLENERLPLLVNATCEFGRQDDPVFISGAELCMLRKQGGAIGLVSTSRPVFGSSNFLLNEAFYNAFFQKENGYLPLGEIFRRTKNNSLNGVFNRNFSLIGDPSMHLAMPLHNIQVTEITTASGSPILKALSLVTVKGEIRNDDNDLVSDFNGLLEATLFDKETSFVTLGDESLPFPYTQWSNALFRGKATVQNGEFEFNFVVPKNIAYQVDEGKLSVYAYDSLHNAEAAGYSQDFEVGSSEPDPEDDSTPPTLQLFIGDTTFVNGGIANPNTTLVARLHDQHGINISGYGIGNSIIGALDDSQSFVLNDYYEADLDDFTRGTISFPLHDLAPGKHTITVKAWDTYNNPVQSTIDFMVTNGEGLVIETFGNFPNPFTSSTTIFFTHNRSGDDLQASLVLYDYTGATLRSYEFHIPFSGYQVDLMELTRDTDFLKNRSGGLYFARLLVRSLSNGSKNEQVTKLIISN